MTNSNVDSIRRSLSVSTRQSLAELECFQEIGSTNTYLLDCPVPSPGTMRVAITERQTAGRGRRDKDWYSPSRSGLWMSVAYTFKLRPENLSALTLAVGATLADELSILGVRNIGLKWPNDLVVGGRKLGGILLESCANGATAVTGIGINMSLPKDAKEHIGAENEPIDLASILPKTPSVERLTTCLIDRLGSALNQFDDDGFKSFVAGWSRFDTLAGVEIAVRSPDGEESGTAQGIADDGALLLKNSHGLRRIVSGSVRMVDCEEAVA
jgi:BirA family biotin operon repressor/biotin-[acetyl-CoA-carboxylase] ligase